MLHCLNFFLIIIALGEKLFFVSSLSPFYLLLHLLSLIMILVSTLYGPVILPLLLAFTLFSLIYSAVHLLSYSCLRCFVLLLTLTCFCLSNVFQYLLFLWLLLVKTSWLLLSFFSLAFFTQLHLSHLLTHSFLNFFPLCFH